ncbi:MAG: hypothetical protein SFU84_00180 [Gemmatimonadales bacterium]|nr:hypothetical protein [Gemmatimonadales bacterium]
MHWRGTTCDKEGNNVRTMPSWGIWLMVGQSALIIGATLVLGWRLHGLRRTAPIVGAMTLLCTLIIGAVARFGLPPAWLLPLVMFVGFAAALWILLPWRTLFGLKPTADRGANGAQ